MEYLLGDVLGRAGKEGPRLVGDVDVVVAGRLRDGEVDEKSCAFSIFVGVPRSELTNDLAFASGGGP